ncbi:MAG: DHA2 family efflux MFS transporter permease subunit [Hyphomicrobiales bacterium]|nr:DHA2 family efflux MFS transporter permease subunit [Hyphomicrobiales bacterium]
MCIGMFMAILDIQIVVTSLPTIQEALGIRQDQMSWVQTSYLIAEIIAIPLTGWLTRLLSLRVLFVIAASVFTLASIGCALSYDFESLIFWRVIQGFAGGMLIPVVFSTVFIIFPGRGQGAATTIAGMLAVLAPTVGPITGGWITSTFSWHWLFLINIPPAIAAIVTAAIFLPRTGSDRGELRNLDVLSLLLLALALATLEISLKEAPKSGWFSGLVIALVAISVSSGAAFIRRTLSRSKPLIDLNHFREWNFVLGCALSFLLGIGLYGSVYLMPVFLGFVRGHDALGIGEIMLVTGAAQLIAAPVAVWMEQRYNARLLTLLGFVFFTIGIALSMYDTPRSDFNEMLLPQTLRGLAVLFCILPPTRIALGHLPPDRVPDGSALYNLMRNLGGAIGIALIDTVVFARVEKHATMIFERLEARDRSMFEFTGLPFVAPEREVTQNMIAFATPVVKKSALTIAITEAWMMLALLSALGILLALLVRNPKPQDDSATK